MKLQRGGVYWAYLDPAKGSEQQGRRPVIVVSPNEVQHYLKRAVVVPVTTTNKDYPTFVPVMIKGSRHYAMLDQLRTLDVRRFKGGVEALSEAETKKLLEQLCLFFT